MNPVLATPPAPAALYGGETQLREKEDHHQLEAQQDGVMEQFGKQENMSIRSSRARHLVMRKLLRKQEVRVLCCPGASH